MHCHLRPPAPPVVFGFNYESHNAPVYQISAQSGNVRLSYRWFNNFSRPFFRRLQMSTYIFLVRVRCRRKESLHSLSHLLMSFLYLKQRQRTAAPSLANHRWRRTRRVIKNTELRLRCCHVSSWVDQHTSSLESRLHRPIIGAEFGAPRSQRIAVDFRLLFRFEMTAKSKNLRPNSHFNCCKIRGVVGKIFERSF